jgi:hypothetical protein
MIADRPMSAPSHIAFRLAALAFAILLGLQCVWLLLAEFCRSGIHLPTDAAAAATAATQRNDAAWAAAVGAVRGDLWAESAFTFADLLWGNADDNPEPGRVFQEALARLGHAIDDAPHQSGTWLLLAGLAARHPMPNLDPVEALKMSYYTGASEQELMPLRLRIALQSKAFDDPEVQHFVSQDLRLALARQHRSTVIEAYSAASPAGKSFIEHIVREIDPELLRAGSPKQ